MAPKFSSLSQAIGSRGLKVCLYGQSGVGKTTQIAALLAVMAVDDCMVVITAEHGLRSLHRLGPQVTEDQRVKVVECTSTKDVQEAVEWVSDKRNGVTHVYVDSVSNIADRALRGLLDGASDPRKAYGELMLRVPNMIWGLVDVAHLSVVLVFQEGKDKVPIGTGKDAIELVSFFPALPTEKMAAAAPYAFDAVLRLEMKDSGERQIRTAKTRTVMCKDRTGLLDALEEADLGKVFQKMMG